MDRKEMKKAYSHIGASYAVFVLIMYMASLIISLIIKKTGVENMTGWMRYLVGLGPIWLVAFPVCYLFIKDMYNKTPDDHSLSFGYGIKFYFMLTFLMITGNIVGRLIAYLIKFMTGIVIDNTTIDLISQQDMVSSLIFVVILGPIMEELAFRKLLIDRLWFFSKKHTIILSALMFALFHTNIYQFFYAFLVGLIFAYIYTITGRIRYSIMLHMTINFIHGIVPLFCLKLMDMGKIARLMTLQSDSKEARQLSLELLTTPGFLLFIVYFLVIIGFVITGLVLFIKNVNKMKVDDTMSPLQKPGAVSVVYGNIGMIAFLVVMMFFTVFEVAIS